MRAAVVGMWMAGCGATEPLRPSPPPPDPATTQVPTAGPVHTVGKRTLNPMDKMERTIFRGQDGCFVNGMKGPAHEKVECPAFMLDPSWSACVGGTVAVMAEGAGCVCTVVGNPPAAPQPIACPKAE